MTPSRPRATMAPTTAGPETVFKKILIANRGEIACRIMRDVPRASASPPSPSTPTPTATRCTCAMADEAVLHRPGAAARELPRRSTRSSRPRSRPGADAIHPGYGFLSENAAFAEALRGGRHRLHRPTPEAIGAMGDKIAREEARRRAGVPTVPGTRRHRATTKHAVDDRRRASAIPVMIKAAAGGGGKGMRIVYATAEDSRRASRRATRRRARFGDDRVFIEKFIEQPAPHRDPGARRQARQRRPPRRARMLDPAAQPEGRRGGALARCSTPRRGAPMGAQAWRWPGRSATTQRRHGRVPRRPATRASTSSR